MRFLSWLRDLTSGLAHSRTGHTVRRLSPRNPLTAPLRFEQLEERWCPAVSFGITDLGTLGGAAGINAFGQVVGGSSLWTPATANGTTGATTGLPTLGGAERHAHAINAFGQVVGESYTAGGENHAFLWTPTTAHGTSGSMIDLGTLGGTTSVAFGLNNATAGHGVQVVGYSSTGSEGHAFLWEDLNKNDQSDPGEMKDLGTLGGTSSRATGINDVSQVCGTANLSGDAIYHAFLWQNNVMTDLGSLGGSVSIVSVGRAINASGQVVGQSYPTKGIEYHAFRWTPTNPNGTTGKMADLGTLNGWYTYNYSGAYGINDLGYVVGNAYPPDSAFYWPGKGNIQDLNKQIPTNSGWAVLWSAAGINNAGQIVGEGQHPSGVWHVFLLTPTSGRAPTAAATATTPVAETLHQDQVAPLLTEAIARWAAAGVDTNSLRGVHVQITDLPGSEIGEAFGHTIYLDANAVGWGWFVDPTPADDSEFTIPGDQGEQNHIDLLTVLEHELGHLLGYEHSANGVMAGTLAAGTRETPTGQWTVQNTALLDMVFAGELNSQRRMLI